MYEVPLEHPITSLHIDKQNFYANLNTMARKSTIQIPVHNVTGNVPHWTHPKSISVPQLASRKDELAAGFQNPMRNDNTPSWKDEQAWINWISWHINAYDYTWRDPWEFVDTFKIVSYGRGRSSAVFNLESTTTGMKCVMMMKDMTDMITTATIVKGIVTGRWIFGKRGQNYGVQYLGESNE